MEILIDNNGVPYKKKKTHDDLAKECDNLINQFKAFEDLMKEVARRIDELEKKVDSWEKEPEEEKIEKPKKTKS